MSILYNNVISGCESSCIRKMIKDMMDCIKAVYHLSDNEEYEFRLILNELIANGTVHGNKRLCNKSITARIEAVDKETISITIQDEGSGFDYRSFFEKAYPCDSNLYSERGRGLKLIKAMCDNIRFNHNGNQIQICKSIRKSYPI
ncbi:MAG TPA: ATP-binding protein [Clostridiales bacterium]|nr:ATP-binding protein [Clostridiales bacterium]